MPEPDLQLLTDAARAAGEIALRFWKRDPQVFIKADQSPVTEADLAVNALLSDLLLGARPDYGWLSEEDADNPARLDAERVFIIDPIDGTRAFINGEDTFALSLAVAEGGRVLAGVVYLPALDRLYSATAQGPALKNGAPIHASDRAGIEGATLLTSHPQLAPQHWPGGVPDLKRSFRTSLAYRLCLVAEGRHDGMLALRDTWEWDIAAGGLIAARAGARVTDRHGGVLRFNAAPPQSPGVLAAAPGLHAALLARLQPLAQG
ncbi:3'(2'),5'-bisphosphate nucleotidase CysQ [Rhodobacter ferrooxidans]|uniref:Inositol-phosphate phosphatase n=1 Tax=Rhodobacter ferrooxidans TaxID=371731 RepID=C8RXA2_9RHOB|nr:3'(2'),5'-bisphosphate nucleotidase CysQ [Rhodobacter sp. SW2]EEW26627.1 Inositol-phosphate phosphatase [Rhodobacter sp. SW2]